MKKVSIGLGIGVAVLFSGCLSVEHIGKGTYKAEGFGGSTSSVSDQKKVKVFLKQFVKKTISKPIGKSLNYKNVIVFSGSAPSDCKKIGYIVVTKDEGLLPAHTSMFTFGQTQPPKNKILEMVQKKAAMYGIKAVSNKAYASMTNIKTEDYILETKNPYESISYIKMGGDTLDGYKMIFKKDLKIDAQCKKTKDYFQCVRKKVTRQAPVKSIYFLHAVTALKCSDKTLKKVKGQTVMSINIENKAKPLVNKFKSLFK